jgi:hypothetical protein
MEQLVTTIMIAAVLKPAQVVVDIILSKLKGIVVTFLHLRHHLYHHHQHVQTATE